MTTNYTDDLDLALELADAADTISLSGFCAAGVEVKTKPDHTPVTEIDLAVERMIRDRLAGDRPNDAILGEEFGAAGQSARQWIIDPIDGTANFMRGVPVWGTLIALALDGTPIVGVASSPALGRRWWAARGMGAWTNAASGARRIRVSNVENLSDASLSFQSLTRWRRAGYLEPLLALSDRVWRDRAYGDFWSYTLLAEGLVDITAEFEVQPYDLAALVPIVEEAGGRFTSIAGQLGPWHSSALATNRRLHDAVLAVLSERHPNHV